ncbi:MAG: NAD(P)-dependent oxidoreductase [Candidatus Pelagadaptatus aseana]|uniref:NAD(P)-dependent oxidoreductase n=1 Tax=Candidatus Pelagadaptatus aseana TaxID=3120508 RepID=UPI0039B295DA
MKRITFIGLGVMGFPMAGHLQQAGFDMTVYNRTTAKAQQWVSQYGGQFAETPAEASRNADLVLCCVGNDDDLRQVTVGEDGAFASLKPGTLFIDHTTASAEVARELSAMLKQQGCEFLDAPVSGGQQGAENAALTIMVGGSEEAFAKAIPVLDVMAKAVNLMGPVGSGQLCKMVNQICIAGLLQGLSEGLNFAKRAGLDAHKVVEVISQGAAQSWQMENRHKTMLAGEYEHGFAVDWMRKDLDIVLTEARNNGTSLPVTALVDQYYADVQAMGGGRWDTSSLMARMEALSGKD